MLTALTTSLLAALALPGQPVPTAPQTASAIRLSINEGGDFQPGDRVNVGVEIGEDGYLLVFRVDGDGYVRVLFPLDPDLDPYVRGDREYELRGRGERQSFMADDRGGTGLVLAVLSRDPFDFSGFATGMHWDYGRLRLMDPAGDAEAQLLGLAREMTADGNFVYDVLGYRVWGPGYESEQPVIVAGGGYDPYFDGSYACLACGWGYPRTGISITVGNRWGWSDPWYDPWYYDPWYYRGNRWNGFWGWDPYWGTPYRPITVITPRPRPVVPDTPYGYRARPRSPVAAIPAGGVPRLSEPVPGLPNRPATRPAEYDNRSRSRGNAPAVTPARRPEPQATPSRRPSEPVQVPRRTGGSVNPPTRSTPPVNTERSRSRRPSAAADRAVESAPRPVTTTPTRAIVPTRRVEERPVYRPPVVNQTPTRARRSEPAPAARPASSAPPRTVQRAPEPQRRVERPAATRSPSAAPSRPAPRPSSSARGSSGSSGKASPPASSSRSRSRGNN